MMFSKYPGAKTSSSSDRMARLAAFYYQEPDLQRALTSLYERYAARASEFTEAQIKTMTYIHYAYPLYLYGALQSDEISSNPSEQRDEQGEQIVRGALNTLPPPQNISELITQLTTLIESVIHPTAAATAAPAARR